MQSNVLTKDVLVKAFQDSKATSISGVWKHLGHHSAISGSQSKRIKETVPNYLQLIEVNKGLVSTAVKTPVVKTVKVAVVEVAKTTKAVRVPKVKGAGGFRQSSNYATLFAEGSKNYVTKEELIAQVSKITGQSMEKTTFNYGVIGSPYSKSNGRRAMLDRWTVEGKIKVVPYNEADYLAWKKAKKEKATSKAK
jgi:hypothetical protein